MMCSDDIYYIEFDKFIFCEVDCEYTSMNLIKYDIVSIML